MKNKPCHCCGGTGTEKDNAILGAKMRMLRESKGISLRSMARRLRYSAAYLSDLERGERNWRDELISAYKSK